jgi:hypothetical protein
LGTDGRLPGSAISNATAFENLNILKKLIYSGATFPDSIGLGKLWLLRLFRKKEKNVP